MLEDMEAGKLFDTTNYRGWAAGSAQTSMNPLRNWIATEF